GCKFVLVEQIGNRQWLTVGVAQGNVESSLRSGKPFHKLKGRKTHGNSQPARQWRRAIHPGRLGGNWYLGPSRRLPDTACRGQVRVFGGPTNLWCCCPSIMLADASNGMIDRRG